ncbi:uncharacterized protein LOC133531991 [Cydia pomonella]|uniref:uncharacterized protein LOC133531991 n=1 Tax=Cydia pomonella TaxID=82600 RepID=UPI002ADDBA32|nr:uncharacterized protein LOC133531991 [Cydia pomonella]
MLRNRGVNVTERKIRQDVLRAYEYDIFDVPRWRYMQESGCQANGYRQPRYCTIPKPVYYQTVRSSTNYGRVRGHGARRVYLPENEWGASSADESMMFIRNPRYNISSYYPNEVFERPYRRERYPDGYYSRRPSSIYMEDEEMERFQATRYRTAGYCPKRHTQLSRKVTRKLSPIFTCGCATTANVKQPTTDVDNDSPKTHHLSKEAKNLSLDICKILSLLQKDRELEDFSSRSLLQNIHDLECHNTNSAAPRDICTQRVQISSKLPNQKQNPSEKFKAATGVRSKLEALLSALKQYEEEKMLNELVDPDIANTPNYNNVIPSDPPSLEVRSFIHEKDEKSSTNIKGQQKDMVLQTEKPKTSNKNVCSKIKTKKDNMVIERKSLRSRLSWKKREATGINMHNYSSNDRLSDKMSIEKGYMKTKSKDRIRPERLPEINSAKQGQATNKAGLMIKIGGNTQRKKPKPPKEKHKDKMPKTWIKKFLESTKDCKNNGIYIRWNNKAFSTKSSSTVFELINNVYKQLGIKDYAKSDEVSVSDIKKMPKKNVHKSKTRIPRSTNKPKYRQKLKAYMMPQTIVPGPVYMPGNVIITDEKHETEKVKSKTLLLHKPKPSLLELPFINRLSTVSYPSSNYFKIHLPKDFFDPVSTTKNEQRISSSQDDLIWEQKYDLNGTTKYLANKHVYMVQGTQSLRFPESSEDWEQNVTRRESESKPTKSQLQFHTDNDTASTSFFRRSCSLVNKIMEHEYLNWMPLSDDSLLYSENCIYSGDKDFTINDEDANINNLTVTLENIDNEIETNDHDYTENEVKIKIRSKDLFRRRNNHSVVNNLGQWRDKTKETFSESLIGIYSRRPVILSVYWKLFWELLKTPKRKSRTPPQDLSLVQPPKITSEPKCSYKPLNISRPQQPLPQKLKIPFEPLRLVQSAHIFPQTEMKVESEKHSSAHHEPLHPVQFALSSPTLPTAEKVGLPKKPLIVEKILSPTQSARSVQALQAEKGETAVKLISCEPPGLVKFPNKTTEESEMSVSIKICGSQCKNVEPDFTSKCRNPIERIRFVRSGLNIAAGNKMKFVFNPSVPLLQQHVRQFHLLLSIQSLNSANSEQELEKKCICNQLLVPQHRNNNLEDVEQKTDNENKRQEEDGESSQIHNGTENSVDLIKACGKREGTATQIKESYDDKEYQKTKTRNVKKKKMRSAKFVTHIPTLKNNVYSSDKPCIHLNKTESVKLSLKIKNGDKITKISILNFVSNKVKNIKSINQTNCQEHVVDNRTCSIEQSANNIANKNVKVFINITNINSEAINSKNSVPDDISKDYVSKEAAVEDQKATKIYSNSQHNSNDDIQSDQHNSVHKSMRSHSLSKSHSQINNMCLDKKLPIYIMEATRPNTVYGLEDSIANVETPRTENYSNNIAAETNLKKLSSNTIDKIYPKKPVVEIKRLLNAMVMVNASDFAGMSVMNEISKEQNETYTTLSEQMLRRNEFVNVLSDINMTKKKTDNKYQAKFFNGEESFDELESGDSRSRCNVLTRKLTSHRRVEVEGNRPTNFNIKEKTHIAANYNIMNIPHLVHPVMQPYRKLEDFVFIGQDDVISSQTMKSKKITSLRKENKFQKGEPICWYCGKRAPRKINIKERVSETCKDNTIILTNVDPCKSQKSSFTEYKVISKNHDSGNINDGDSKINKADILQSQIIKKAVLQIYSETVANEGYIVAKIPKYLRLPTS